MPCSSQGAVSQLAINGKKFPFELIDDQSVRQLVDDNDEVITGFFDPLKERVSLGPQILTLNIRLRPTPLEMSILMPFLGLSNTVGNTWEIQAESNGLASFPVIVDRVAKVHTYTTCYFNRWTLQGQKGTKPLALDVQIFGATYAEGNAGSFTADALQTDAPYPFTGGTLTARAAARTFDRFALSVNHFLEREFENQLTANCIDMTRRKVTLATSVPYVAANTALLNTPFVTDADGAGLTLAFARGGQSTSIVFENMKEIARPPGIAGKQAIRLPVFWQNYRTIANKAFAITHDSAV
jgi:hypothetical protein